MTASKLNTAEQLKSLWSLGGLTWKELARRFWSEMTQADLIDRAYELAYNFLLAVFPLLFFVFSLFGIFASQDVILRTNFYAYVQLVLPPAGYQILAHTVREITTTAGTGKLTFGLVLHSIPVPLV